MAPFRSNLSPKPYETKSVDILLVSVALGAINSKDQNWMKNKYKCILYTFQICEIFKFVSLIDPFSIWISFFCSWITHKDEHFGHKKMHWYRMKSKIKVCNWVSLHGPFRLSLPPKPLESTCSRLNKFKEKNPKIDKK